VTYHAQHDNGINVRIEKDELREKSDMRYPFYLEIDGNYEGDFLTLKAAKEYAETEVARMVKEYDESHGGG
jgi:hypothetical protein